MTCHREEDVTQTMYKETKVLPPPANGVSDINGIPEVVSQELSVVSQTNEDLKFVLYFG